MSLPLWIRLLGYAGLVPFLAGPLWLWLAPQTAPAQLDHWWLSYAALLASFLAGSFWGIALTAIEGPDGKFGILVASLLMLLAWAASALPFSLALLGLGLVFLLLLLADFWRERTLGSVEGYFILRTTLTVGVLVALVWRWALL
jgi:hypothetical protein